MDERIMFTKTKALRLGVPKGCRGNSGPTDGTKIARQEALPEICEVCKKWSYITRSILYRCMLHF